MDRGLMVIPKVVREDIGITSNSYVSLVEGYGAFTVRPVINSAVSGLTVIPAKYKTREERLAVLAKIKKPIWTDADYKFWLKGRKEMAKRAKKFDKWEPYWEK